MRETIQTSLGEPLVRGFSMADGWGQFERAAVARCRCGCGEHVNPKGRSLFASQKHYRNWLKLKLKADRGAKRMAKLCKCGCQAHLLADGRSSPYLLGHAPKKKAGTVAS